MHTALLTRRRGGATNPFDPATLFASGEVGAWYAPGVGSLQIANGAITEAGPGDPVGFQLDRSQGAGFSNGAFTGCTSVGAATSWTGSGWDTETINGGQAEGEKSTPGGNDSFYSNAYIYCVTGVPVLVRVTFGPNHTLSSCGVGLSSATNGRSTGIVYAGGAGTVDFIMLPLFTGTFSVILYTALLGVLDVDAVEAFEIPGNHATQSTAAARPALRASPAHVEADGVDDVSNWTAAADNYTIGRVNSSGTVTIQTAQALSGATNIFAAENDIAGYIAVNRALTGSETTDVTTYLGDLVP